MLHLEKLTLHFKLFFLNLLNRLFKKDKFHKAFNRQLLPMTKHRS